MKKNLQEFAAMYAENGYSVLPVSLKTKKPQLESWKEYQYRIMKEEEILEHFNGNTEAIAIVCGEISGNTEVLDIDNKAGTAKDNYAEFRKNPLVSALFEKYDFPVEKTQSGGFHILYRCDTITGSRKLAKDFLPGTDKTTDIFETKGEGGYFICDPSPGYKVIEGSLLNIPKITPRERLNLIKVAMSFDKVGKADAAKASSGLQEGEGKPLSKAELYYNENGLEHFTSVLSEAGWQESDTQPRDEDKVYYTRPGKGTDKGHSATLHNKLKVFHVFSDAGEFDISDSKKAGKGFTLSEALAVLKFGADAEKASKWIAKEYLEEEATLEEAIKALVEEIPPYESPETFKTEKHKAAAIALAIVSKRPDIGKLNGELYIYTGKYWHKLTEEESLDLIREAGLKAGFKRIDVTQHTLLDHTLKDLFVLREVKDLTPPEDKALINLQNGTLEISQEERILRPHDKEDRLTYILDFGYYEQAEAPLFQKFLSKVLPDQTLQNLIAEFIGYSFLNMKMEKVMIFHGTGQNGKSVTAEIIIGVLGAENTSSVSMSNLIQPNGYYRPMIAGKRINIGTDEAMKQFHSDIFKKMASGEEIEARNIYGRPFLMRVYAKLLFLMNKLPATEDFSKAFFRRLIIIPFRVYVSDEEKIIDLHKLILEDEKPGILNWILFGVERLLANERFSESTKAEAALNEYRNESNSVISFVLEEWKKQSSVPDKKRQLKGMYQDYIVWCKESGRKPVGKITFSERLQLAGFEKTTITGTNQSAFFLNEDVKKKIEHG